MGLTKCPGCSRLCFSKYALCPNCSRVFEAGELDAKVTAENRAFNKKSNMVFLTIFLILMGVLVFVELRPQPTNLPANTNLGNKETTPSN